MTQLITLTWDSDVAALHEAMLTAGRDIYGSRRWLIGALMALAGFLIALGGAATVAVIGLRVVGTADLGVWWFLLGSGLAVGLFILYQHLPLRWIAQLVARSAFGAGAQSARIDAAGITFSNAHADWRTDWAAVASIQAGRRGITVAVSGIAFALPLSAFESRQAMLKLAQTMQDLREASR